MALSDAYATAAEYRTVTGKTDTGSDTQILIDLKAISRHIDNRLGRFFTKDASAVNRVYIPPRTTKLLMVDDISASAGVTVTVDDDEDGSFADETALDTSDWELWPLNADKDPEPRPFTAIHLPSWSDASDFQSSKRVQVNAAFGWPSVPGPIKQATIQLTAIYRLETPLATRRVSELGDSIEASPTAVGIVNRLLELYWRPR